MEHGNDGVRVGEILVRQQLLRVDELEHLLQLQPESNARLLSLAVRWGHLTEKKALAVLSKQHGVPALDLSQVVITLKNLEHVPRVVAEAHGILPIVEKQGQLFLAMTDPTCRRLLDEIEFATGLRVFPYAALHSSLHRVLHEAYTLLENGESTYVGTAVPNSESLPVGATSQESLRAQMPRGVVLQLQSMPPNAQNKSAVIDSEAKLSEWPKPVSEHPRSQFPVQPGKKLALVVDDEPHVRALIRQSLLQAGIEVVEASDGAEALKAVDQHAPDVILLDAVLPDLHGFEVCKRLRESPLHNKIPIIMVSGVHRGWRVAQDLQNTYGVYRFVEKPFVPEKVVQVVNDALSPHSGSGPEVDSLTGDAAAQMRKADAAFRAGRIDDAISALRQGVQLDPFSFRMHYQLGLILGKEEQVFSAIESLERSIGIRPNHFSALRNLAVLYERAGFRHKSIEMWERALGQAKDDETRAGIRQHLMEMIQ